MRIVAASHRGTRYSGALAREGWLMMSAVVEERVRSGRIVVPPVLGEDEVVDRSLVRDVPRDLPVGISEIGVLLDVERQTVDVWRWRGRFPDPQRSTIGGRPWWVWGDVLDWAVETGRLFLEPDPGSVGEADRVTIHPKRS